jgi:UDP-N-acetylglucosamine diphosphorylase/glucosamine-1-phosphate N-acetyltransferase
MISRSVILFDGDERKNLLPFTFTRPVCDILIGILTIREKWERRLKLKTTSLTEDYLSEKFPATISEENIFIAGNLIPDKDLVKQISTLKKNEAIHSAEKLVAVCLDATAAKKFCAEKKLPALKSKNILSEERMLNHKWQIFKWNDWALTEDFQFITKGRKSQKPSSTNTIIGKKNFFLEKGATMEGAIINASTGVVYIGKDSAVMEGATIRGPFSLGENGVVKMQAKIYGATTVGPNSKVGGEINNSILFANSNKTHDGYLGNSVIGEWCNLGADTNNSNLKNDYSEVKQWNYGLQSFENTGEQFCGLMMGDHSKCGINTMFNTGTVVGVSANIFGDGFPRQFIPSFSWGGASGFSDYQINKAIKVAQLVMQRRNIEFTEADKKILTHIYNLKDK